MSKQKKCSIKGKNNYSFRYCYVDTNDKDTLQFWIIYYKNSFRI